MKYRYLLLLPVLAGLSACTKQVDHFEDPPESIEGYAPVYDTSGNIKTIASKEPEATVNAGKIYVKGSILYQVEDGKGIHVINISDVTKPTKLKFLKVSGCEELAIQGNMLYTNNLNDLVVVDIADINAPVEKYRIQNAFHIAETIPPVAGWHECADPTKGTVIGWVRKTLHYPQCNKL